jgi:DNA-binding NtrC family response regulator
MTSLPMLLPETIAMRGAAAAQPAIGPIPQKTAPTILWVDDDAGVRNSVARVLATEGMHVVMARGAKDALDHIDRNPTDLVVTDLCMAPLTGWDLILHLRYHHPKLPIIVVTALSPQTAGVAKRDAVAFFQKPLDLDALLDAIRNQFRRAGFSPNAAAQS